MNLGSINSSARWQTWLLLVLGCPVAGGLLALVARTVAYATGYSVSAIALVGAEVASGAGFGLIYGAVTRGTIVKFSGPFVSEPLADAG